MEEAIRHLALAVIGVFAGVGVYAILSQILKD